jgi:hypothetical protein
MVEQISEVRASAALGQPYISRQVATTPFVCFYSAGSSAQFAML